MYKNPRPLLDYRCAKKNKIWRRALNPNRQDLGWISVCLRTFLLWPLLGLSLGASVSAPKVEHEGLCPNKLNTNLWVDAQSTCERECNVDEVRSRILFTKCYLFKHIFFKITRVGLIKVFSKSCNGK